MNANAVNDELARFAIKLPSSEVDSVLRNR
jgi:hypothetical protein